MTTSSARLAATRASPDDQGDLAKNPLAAVLASAAQRSLTGTLRFMAADGTSPASISLRGGLLRKVKTADPVAYLGRVLFELGTLTDDALNRSLLALSKKMGLHGKLLVEDGYITREQLVAGLTEQAIRKTVSLASLPPNTKYAFYASVDLLDSYGGDDGLDLPLAPIIWRVVRQGAPRDEVAKMLARLGGAAIHTRSFGDVAKFGFEPEVARAVDKLRSPQPIATFLGTCGLPPRVAELLLYCLSLTRHLETSAPISGVHASTRGPSSATPSRPADMRSERASAGPMSTAPASAPQDFATRRREIEARAAAAAKQDHFEALGLTRESTIAEAQQAFLKLAKQWHPDRLPAQLRDAAPATAQVFARIAEAHRVLTDGEVRAEYVRRLTAAEAAKAPKKATAEDAAAVFKLALASLRAGELAQADERCRRACAAAPANAVYSATLIWIDASKPENQKPAATRRSVDALGQILAKDASCERAYFYRGMLHKRLEDTAASLRDLRRAVELDSTNIEAARELRLHEAKGGSAQGPVAAKDGGGSLLSKLLRKA